MKNKKFAVVGAGFSGSVIARTLADNGYQVKVYESRDHIAGNCHTERDPETNILIHKYGPHIFHTNSKTVWNYINQYSDFEPYINRVKTRFKNNIFSLPINLHTINQFFKTSMSPSEAKEYVSSLAHSEIEDPISFEEQALKFVGKDLYNAFFKEYTLKQWGIDPKDLPASILKRLPLRFNYDDNYFNHEFQGMPKHGYTAIVEKILKHKNIEIYLSKSFEKKYSKFYDHIFYTGPIDNFFEKRFGSLPYRTLDFKKEVHHGDYQGCAVMNYPELNFKYTRISEHKYFSPWEQNEKTVIFKEYSRDHKEGDIPYYPIRLINDKELLKKYIDLAENTEKISFIGRLGTYRYLDMDVTIKEALDFSEGVINSLNNDMKIKTFSAKPI